MLHRLPLPVAVIALLPATLLIQCSQAQSVGLPCEEGAVRLRNGTTEREGRVELCLNGIWGTVCDDNWNDNAATVVCRQLDFSETGATAVGGGFFSPGIGSVLLDEVSCSGEESNLTQCEYSSRHDCRHVEDAGVICEVAGFSCEDGDVRLARGHTEYEGRVEYCLNNRFGVVCDDGQWDDPDAQVVCNQLGYGEYEGSAIAIEGGNYGPGVGPIHLTGLNCNGNESSLANCTIRETFFSRFCSRTFSAGVLCPTPNATCANGDVRLQNGRLASEGRVEVCYNNHWGTVCHDGWGVSDATVVCRELGFSTNGSIPITFSDFGAGEGLILLSNVACTGEEANLAECRHRGIASHTCDHGDDSGVVCQDPENACEEGDIRLEGGRTDNEGRLEICFFGHWGTVCDDLFSNADASVVCRQLGFQTEGALALSRALFGEGRGLIFLDNTECVGNETRLEQCSHLGIGASNCLHTEDISIICAADVPGGCTNGDIRLVGGHGNFSGRVEVCFNNVWGTVCDDDWGRDDSEVVCQQLGFDPEGSVGLGNAYFGVGKGPIFLDDVDCSLENDSSIIDCFLTGDRDVGLHNCIHAEDASVICPVDCGSGSGSGSGSDTEQPSSTPDYCNCTNGDVRLVGGATNAEGRLELCLNGEWGTVCNNLWSNLDAVVVCNQLGFAPTDATAFDSAEYGQGSGHILLDSFLCTGDEEHLLDCYHKRAVEGTCSHRQDVGVKCSSTRCSDGEIRLAGGQLESEGRVEICFNAQFGTICDDGFGQLDAVVACRQLGYNNGVGAIALPSAYFGEGTRGVAAGFFGCNGTEENLIDCDHTLDPFFCFPFEDVSVLCQSNNTNCSNGELRLAGSSDPHEGRVEVCFNGNWGSVCENGWSNIDALTVCSILGYNENDYAIATDGGYFGVVAGPIFLDNVNCTGVEDSILDCLSQDPGLHRCVHSQDSGVLCPVSDSSYECVSGDVRLMGGAGPYEGRVELCINGVWGTVCDDFWDNRDAAVVCNQLNYGRINATAQQRAFFGAGEGPIYLDNVQCDGTEDHLVECTSIGAGSFCFHSEDAGVKCREPDCTNGEVRLFGGELESEGTIEICQNERWGTVCDDFWDSVDAGVVCRQLGYVAERAVALRGAHFGRGDINSPILVDDVECLGNESSLLDCTYDDTPFCFHSEDAGVICPDNFTANCTNGEVRLVDGNSDYQGRVEVCIHGRWGAVCDDLWDSLDAQVVCNQLGLNVGGIAYGGGGVHFGGGNRLIYLDNVECDGTEATLLNCRGVEPGAHNCDPSENAGVFCPKPNATCANGDVRLVGGSGDHEGRVEVCLDESWGTVCADFFWDDEAAEVICRQLGLPWESALAVGNSVFGLGIGRILLSGVSCIGNESNILQCPSFASFFFIPFFCQDHTTDAGVVCYFNDTCSDGDIRLVDGAVESEGRVEMCLDDHWGTVCDDLWNNEDAAVVCRQLGYPSEGALAISRAFFGSGFGRIHLDDLECDGTEEALINCSHRGEQVHNCGHIEDAGVICIIANDSRCEHGSLRFLSHGVPVEEPLMAGTLEVCFGGNWGTICDDLWDSVDASVACRQLGFSDIGAIAHLRAQFGQGTGPIFMDNMRCIGNETRIDRCRSDGLAVHNCGHSEDAGATCRPIPCVDGTLRLVSGYSPVHGRLEVCRNEQWGTVCGTGFTDEMASIACAAMNLTGEGAFRSAEGLFERSPRSRPMLTLTACGNSSDCAFDTAPAAPTCTHANDVGVFCREESYRVCETGAVRLVGNAIGDTEGRLEVCINDQWGTVCDDSWDTRGANLMCQLLNYTGAAETVSASKYGDVSGVPILLDDVKCTGSESNILSCSQLPLNTTHNCVHDEDVAIDCEGSVVCQEGAIQLINGDYPTEGTIQLCMNNAWGTVCDDFFDNLEATVICRQLGYTGGPALALRGAYFGQGTGSVLLDDLFCTGNESTLLECTRRNLHNCNHVEDAGVICPNPADTNCTNGDLRLVNGATQYQGRVEMCLHGHWGTVCDDLWDDLDAQVVCNQLGYNSEGFASSVSFAAFGRGTGVILLDNVQCTGTEEDLLECPSNAVGIHNCGHTEDAGVYCPDPTADCVNGEIRLEGGANEFEGRVEMCIAGEWGTICGDRSWDDRDAMVVCRQLNYDGRIAVGVGSPAAFGPGEGRVLYRFVGCNGSENALISCPSSPVRAFTFGCTHRSDASVICQNPNATCTEGDIRLGGGATDNEGRVEICLSNHWGALCDNGWDINDAMVVCRQLNFSTNGVIPKNAGFFGRGLGRVHLDNLNCTGRESRLQDCPHSAFEQVTCRSFEDDVGIICPLRDPECTHGDIRLEDGLTPLEGRVELCIGGRWGTVCDDFWGAPDANVVCRQLGYSGTGASARFDVIPGSSNMSILLDNLQCLGTEASLLDCPALPVGTHNCGHYEDAGVTCLPLPCTPGDVRIVGGVNPRNGRMEMCVNEVWGTVCDQGFSNTDAASVCTRANFSGDAVIGSPGFFSSVLEVGLIYNSLSSNSRPAPSACTHADDMVVFCGEEVSAECSTGSLRLYGSDDRSKGRVQVCLGNMWGTICDDSWQITSSILTCGLLGKFGGERISASNFGNSTDFPIFLDNLKCKGTESNLLSCPQLPLRTPHDCTHTEDVALQCLEEAECTEGAVRLVAGSSDTGRVEMCKYGQWGAVCADNEWDDTDAETVCRQLSLPGGKVVGDAGFGEGSGSLIFSQFQCSASDNKLIECPFDVITRDHCSNDAEISCIDPSVVCSDGTVRLVDGATNFSGRVELCSDNQWNSVCSERWGQSEATVVCRQLQYPPDGARASPGGFFEGGDVPPVSETFNCQRDEQRLDRCSKTDNTTCSGVAGVFCQAVTAQCEDGQLRLVDGKSEREGRLQVCLGGLWGTVCDNSSQWGQNEATVTCRNLGFSENAAKVGSNVYKGVGSGPVFIGSTVCTGSESDLLDCNITAAMASCSNHQNDVGVSCLVCTEGGVRLVGGSSRYVGRVEVCVNAVWGTVCADGVTQSDAESVCTKQGFSGDGAILTGGGFFDAGNGAIFNSLNGSEPTDSCTHENDVGVICPEPATSPSSCVTGDVRLSGKEDDSVMKRVEVCYNGAWGTVCNDGWDDSDAKVVCQQLELDSKEATAQTVGGGSGEVLLSNIKCGGEEAHILSCIQSPLGTINHCTHNEDAGVICTNVKVEPTTEPKPTAKPTTEKPAPESGRGSSSSVNAAAIVVPIILVILLIVLIIVTIVLGVLYYRKRKTGKTIFTVRSQPDQLPFAESTSFPEGLSDTGEPEKEKTETL